MKFIVILFIRFLLKNYNFNNFLGEVMLNKSNFSKAYYLFFCVFFVVSIYGCDRLSLEKDVIPECGSENSLGKLKELAITIKKNQLNILIGNQKRQIQRDILGDGWGELGSIFSDVLMKEVAPLPDPKSIVISAKDVEHIRSEYYSRKDAVRVCLAQVNFDFSIPKIKTKGGTEVDRFIGDTLLAKYNINMPKENQFRYSIRKNEKIEGTFVVEVQVVDTSYNNEIMLGLMNGVKIVNKEQPTAIENNLNNNYPKLVDGLPYKAADLGVGCNFNKSGGVTFHEINSNIGMIKTHETGNAFERLLMINGTAVVAVSEGCPELIRKTNDFQYWAYYAGDGGNACAGPFVILSTGQGGYKYIVSEACDSLERLKSRLRFNGLDVVIN